MSTSPLSRFHPISLIATYFSIGCIPFAPGTFGSLAAFPTLYAIAALINHLPIITNNYEVTSRLITSLLLLLVAVAILFVIGVIASHLYVKHTGKEDPGEVVIDEVVGQSLTLTLILPSLLLGDNMVALFIAAVTGSFILFRFFDIRKPWPVNWCDTNIKGGIGIMVDDIVAALMASVSYYALLFLVSDALKWAAKH